ncbi:hypothetical protein ACP8HI_26290 [Paenibacillus sp. FA6]|uniref:hypothetical protein n=1 Tax=Paenibacillus sp. FA6 TaxID=3413029 RepID=UPI003F6589B1
MSKGTIAKSYKVGDKDETGVFVDLNFICPHCDFEDYKMILVRAKDFDEIDNGFETDQECYHCGKDMIVQCR